jgi:hypothetical protein
VAGKPLNARGLATRLGKYGVKSKTVRIGDHTPRGYTREDLADAWARYLPPLADESATSATSKTTTEATPRNPHEHRENGHQGHVAESLRLSKLKVQQRNTSATDSSRNNAHVADVVDVVDLQPSRGTAHECVECGEPTTGPNELYCPAHEGWSTTI